MASAVPLTSSTPGPDTTPSQPQPQQDDSFISSTLRQSSHPTAMVFHVLFRLSALVYYLLCQFFIDNFILNFVILILLLSFDFWTVKNVSGRLLVGLRWWNEVKEDGTSVWLFESKSMVQNRNKTDERIFWMVLYVFPIIWVVLAFVALIKLSFVWLGVASVALTMTSANLAGYIKCDKDAKKKMQGAVAQGLMGTMLGAMNPLKMFT